MTMGNMSYCRFQNTARDLDACKDALEEMMDGGEPLSEEECRAARELMVTALDMVLLVTEHADVDAGELDDHNAEAKLMDAVSSANRDAERAEVPR